MIPEKKGRFSYYEEQYTDIIFAEFPGNLRVDLELAKQIVSNRLDFTKGKKHYLIIDFSNVRQVSTEAKEFMQHPDGGLKNILGAAFIASNPLSALLANIFIKSPADFQAKFFANSKDAFDWILHYRQQKDKRQALRTER